jgi:hypothetical protein
MSMVEGKRHRQAHEAKLSLERIPGVNLASTILPALAAVTFQPDDCDANAHLLTSVRALYGGGRITFGSLSGMPGAGAMLPALAAVALQPEPRESIGRLLACVHACGPAGASHYIILLPQCSILHLRQKNSVAVTHQPGLPQRYYVAPREHPATSFFSPLQQPWPGAE